MLRVLIPVVVLAFTIYCVVDAVQTEDDKIRGLPKALWLLMILIFPLVGGTAWLIAGRPVSILDTIFGPRRPGLDSRGPVGPDDDPDFLKGL
ncbi:PLDc N-terminal domain-containing protein [Ornithinimicrobium panacihumi]|uniref:PLDc N-terminal domain-containing protein n=1 Tax=Ornithinimicrobium panacihumi TaxID=2008449 RepID=UPI003F895229